MLNAGNWAFRDLHPVMTLLLIHSAFDVHIQRPDVAFLTALLRFPSYDTGLGPALEVPLNSLLCDKNSLNRGLSVAAQEAVILSPVSQHDQMATSVVLYRKSAKCDRVDMYGMRTMVAIEALEICQVY
jgi:hypothetical protein